MLVFVPISVACALLGGSPTLLFILSGLAIVPLAGFMGTATEDLSKYYGSAVGGLLNATFGNATELIIVLVALHSGQTVVVKASLIGSIVGNVLLVLGLSVFLGGLKFKFQTFNKDMAGMHAAMLAMSIISLLVPALFVQNMRGHHLTDGSVAVQRLSLGVAATLFTLYIGSLFFSLRTHESLFRTGDESAIQPHWKKSTGILVLLVCSGLVALESEYLVHSISPVVSTWHMSMMFIGIIVLPVIGNAAEHATAVTMAMRDKMDISMNIAFSSSTQIAMFVAPVAIFAGMLMGRPMSVLFTNDELISVAVSVVISHLITLDGKSHWLEGAQLLAAYIILGLAYYFIV
jgi:Ca2+:H+ antiporter